MELCGDAFTPRPLHTIPLLRFIAPAVKRSKYRTTPFEAALHECFGDWPFFGGRERSESSLMKVALTSTTNVEQIPVVLTNYNRPEPEGYSTSQLNQSRVSSYE